MNETLRTKHAAFGLTAEGAHYPDEGMEVREIDGVRTWVMPRPARGNANRNHRMLAECPACGAIMSAGRLHQHKGTATCFKNRSR